LKGFHLVVLIGAVLLLSGQTAYFIYVKLFHTTSSVLDESIDDEIQEAVSLEELLLLYRSNQEQIIAHEAQLSPDQLSEYPRRDREPYATERKITDAIRDWESKKEQYKKLLFYWLFGSAMMLGGIIVYRRERGWVGTTFIFSGLVLTLWWSSPSINLGGAVLEYQRILNTKLILTTLTAAFVAFIWITWRPSAAEQISSKPHD